MHSEDNALLPSVWYAGMSMSIGQAREHAPHSVQSSGFPLTLINENREVVLRMAVIGHSRVCYRRGDF